LMLNGEGVTPNVQLLPSFWRTCEVFIVV
jgi:hypothetical protein